MFKIDILLLKMSSTQPPTIPVWLNVTVIYNHVASFESITFIIFLVLVLCCVIVPMVHYLKLLTCSLS